MLPSPPQSESPSSQSSPIFSLSPTLTPPESPRLQLSPPPSPLLSPLPPLTVELFLLTLRLIQPQEALLPLLLVSKAFHSFLSSEPSLWSTLCHRLDLDSHVPRSKAWAARAGVNGAKSSRGGINSLSIATSGRREHNLDPRTAAARFGELIDDLSYACIPAPSYDAFGRQVGHRPSTLAYLQVSLTGHTHTTANVLQIVAESRREPLFCNLRGLEIAAGIPDLLVSENFFSLWPTLSTIKIVSTIPPSEGFAPTRWRWYQEHNTSSSSDLRSLTLVGTTVSQLNFPTFPVLTAISLSRVAWEGKSLFFLLRICRRTLVKLECLDLELREFPGEEYDDWQACVDVRDPDLIDDYLFDESEDEDTLSDDGRISEIAPILFPHLRILYLSGDSTPPLFASLEFATDYGDINDDLQKYPTPVFYMPQLEHATMEDLATESEIGVDEGDAPLTVFGRNAPNLVSFDLSSSLVTDQYLFSCLAGMQGRLRSLVLTSTGVTDKLLVHLPALVPHLQELDVRKCPKISIQGVARLVEVSRDAQGPMRLWRVRVDPPRWSDAEYIAYRWLAFIDVLVREPWDFESDGPPNAVDRRRWIKEGKLGLEKEQARRRAEDLRREEEQKYQASLAAASQVIYPPRYDPTAAFALPPQGVQ